MPRPKLKSDDEVLEAATAVLKRCGPINFTLSEVANEVGLSRAALIQRFTNRDTLLVRMMERSVGQVRVHLDAMPAGAGPSIRPAPPAVTFCSTTARASTAWKATPPSTPARPRRP